MSLKTYQFLDRNDEDEDSQKKWIVAPNLMEATIYARDHGWDRIKGHEIFDEERTAAILKGDGLGGIDVVISSSKNIALDERELATVLAALRYWQQFITEHPEGDQGPLDDIATDGGKLDPLNPDDIDALCERINV